MNSIAPLCEECKKGIFFGKPEKINLSFSSKNYLEEVYVCGQYQGNLKKIIQSFKYNNQRKLAYPLAELMLKVENDFLKTIDYLVPVPLHKKRETIRGYNQMKLLGKIMEKELGKPLRQDLIFRQKNTIPQYGLNQKERFKNIKDAFSFNPKVKLKRENILLIDDICTTGITLIECAKVLRTNNAGKIFGLVIAHD